MRKVYVRELKPYSFRVLIGTFGTNVERTKWAIEELMVRGIVRYRTGAGSESIDISDTEDAAPDELYQFAFVGMVMVGDVVIVAYPKYYRDRVPTEVELKQILRILKRDADRTSIAKLADDGENRDDKLPIMLALLELYGEYGVYSNYVEKSEINGNGVIDWNRTIGNYLPLASNNRPIYIKYESRKTLHDESDFIMRLHRAVLTECSNQLIEADVSSLLSLDEIWLTDEIVEDLGDSEALEWRLERELSSQFVDWKIATLELLERYLFNRESRMERNDIRALGTTNFYHLWEEACKVAFGDKLDTRLSNLDISLAEGWIGRKCDTLLGIIPHPKWQRHTDQGYGAENETDTLIPDTITFATNENGASTFCIYDAKYYAPSTSGKMKKQPGLESITKQFLYQAAYKQFVLDHGFDEVTNAFLVPSAKPEVNKIARVTFSEVMGEVESPLSNYIDMWALPAYDVFEAYLQGERAGDIARCLGDA